MSEHEYESEDDDFNPAPAVLSDDEDAAPSRKRQRSSSPQDSPPKSKSRRRDDDNHDHEDEGDDGDDEEIANPRRRYNDEDEEDEEEVEEEDEEDEDEEDEDDEDIQRGHRRKRRRDHRAALFDIEAEVDDEDEDEDDERDAGEIGDFIDNEPHPDDFVDSAVDDDRRHRELDARRELDAHMDAEAQAELMKKKYGHRRPTRGHGDDSVVPRRLLLPSVRDPGIWAVRCKEGKERDVVFSIMRRMEERMGTKDELKITAAFERGGKESLFRGIVYVEAHRLIDVTSSLNGILNVYPNNKVVLIDVKDMPELFRVTKAPALEPGAWVRLTRPPKHADDLAQVMDVTENGLEARVRFIPRIDYAARREAAAAAAAAAAGGGKRKRPFGGSGPTVRPPQKLYSEAEARKNHYTTNDEFENGFQVKDVRIQWLKVADVNPTLEEVTKFTSGAEDGTENLDLKALAASLRESAAAAGYLPGDIVEVYAGEQNGVVGRTLGVRGAVVTVSVAEGDLTGEIMHLPVKGLRKRFRIGDHVKVTGGSRFRDEVGMIVKIDQDRVTFLSDQTNGEVTVFSKDLREAGEGGGQTSLGQYSLLDLVQLDPTTVGCIVKVDRESVTVLDQNGDTRQVMASQIANLLPKRKTAVAADRNGSEIRLDDVVREAAGQHRQGKIMHIHRAHLFVHTTTTTENSGVFVTRSSNVNTIAAKGGRITGGANASGTAPGTASLASGPDLSAMNPALRRNNNASGDAKMMPPPPKTFGRDRAIGQTVVVRKGPYKGLLGIVKDTTDTNARVELHTKSKVINVPKACLSFKDKNTGDRIDIGRGAGRPLGGAHQPAASSDWRAASAASAGVPDRTPAWGTRTPAVDTGRTPAWKAQSYDRGNRTPAWADGSRTVNPYDGSRTAYGNAPRTPAWQSGARTPAPDSFSAGAKTPAWQSGSSGSDHRGLDSWGSGSRTPYGASAPTPGASLHDSHDPWPPETLDEYPGAPTPGAGLGALGAPTPAIHMDAPTPGASYELTPGAYHSAPTPGVVGAWDSAPTPSADYSAPTPGAYMPETPAPRYDDDDDD